MKTILLADDEENLRILVRTALEDPGYEIVEAGDGAQALELAGRLYPDLILLDWMMPAMTGVEVARRLRANTGTAQIPIVLLTAKGQDEDRTQALEAGVSSYLVKPFSPRELMEHVEELLGQAPASQSGGG
jgi:two-component system phosphate regulon response regulator PhoB